MTPTLSSSSLITLRDALQTNDSDTILSLPSLQIPFSLLRPALSHSLPEIRLWTWANGGEKVVDAALLLIWNDHSVSTVRDFVAELGKQAFYESYLYRDSTLADTEFLWLMAPVIGYPDLRWAAVTNTRLLNLALRNPYLNTRFAQRVLRWAESNEETAVEAEAIREALSA